MSEDLGKNTGQPTKLRHKIALAIGAINIVFASFAQQFSEISLGLSKGFLGAWGWIAGALPALYGMRGVGKKYSE